MSGNKNRRPAASASMLREINRQIRKMSDAEVYAMTFASDSATRRIANRIAHQRAEAYALSQE